MNQKRNGKGTDVSTPCAGGTCRERTRSPPAAAVTRPTTGTVHPPRDRARPAPPCPSRPRSQRARPAAQQAPAACPPKEAHINKPITQNRTTTQTTHSHTTEPLHNKTKQYPGSLVGPPARAAPIHSRRHRAIGGGSGPKRIALDGTRHPS